MSQLKRILIKDGSVFDPAQGWRGERRDLYLSGGRVSEPFRDPEVVIESGGRAVLAGGVDPHCHLVHPGQALMRMFGALCGPEEIGKAYASAGYVHVHHPFVTLVTAASARRSLALVPYVDKSYGVALDLRDMGKAVRGNDRSQFAAEARALLHLTGAQGLFLPFPWLRHRQRHYIQKNISPKKVLEFLSALEDEELKPVALWCRPGVLDNEIPRPDFFHFTALADSPSSDGLPGRASGLLEAGASADLVAACEDDPLELSTGQTVSPGSISIDIGLGEALCFAVGGWRGEPRSSPAGEGTWRLLAAAGESWRISLCSSTPGRVVMGGLPRTCAWLVSREARPQEVDELLGGRVVDLYEIARLTRFEPARRLGLSDMGHLGVGARANVAIYDVRPGMPAGELVTALSHCWCLIKDGVLVREKGEFTGETPSVTIRFREIEADVASLAGCDLLQNPTLRLEHLWRNGRWEARAERRRHEHDGV